MTRLGEFFARSRRWWWVVPLLWLLLTLAVVRGLPQISAVAQSNSSAFIPADAGPSVAQRLLRRIGKPRAHGSQLLVVAHRSGGLDAADREALMRALEGVTVGRVTGPAPARGPSPFISSDATTDFAVVTVNLNRHPLSSTVAGLYHRLRNLPPGVKTAVTGSDVITHSYSQASLAGMARTLQLTVVLIVIILLLVFRSPLAPLIPLLTIGTSFLTATGLVALWGQHGLPVSTFTEEFMIAIMFGAGTDYSILLLARYREELERTADVSRAIVATMRAVGRTAVVSALTLVLAFGAVVFAHFSLYRSGVGVAVGVAVVALAILTLVPALMVGLGGHLFWPYNPVTHAPRGHEGRGWHRLARLATTRGAVAAIPLAVLVVLALMGQGRLSYDDLEELSPSLRSVQGFNWIQQGFGGGQTLPTSVVLQSRGPSFRSVAGIQALSQATRELDALPGVRTVEGPTAPLGQPLTGLELTTQARRAARGVARLQAALGQLSVGLSAGARQGQVFLHSAPRLTAGTHRLTVGATLLVGGLGQVEAGSLALDRNTGQLVSALDRLEGGLTREGAALSRVAAQTGRLTRGMNPLVGASAGVASGALTLETGAAGVDQSEAALARSVASAAAGLRSLEASLSALARQDPRLLASPGYRSLTQGLGREAATLGAAATSARALVARLGAVVGGAGKLAVGAGRLNQGIDLAQSGMSRLAAGIAKLDRSTAALAAAAAKLSAGAEKLHGGAGGLETGVARNLAGARSLARGLTAMDGQLGPLASAPRKLVAGLDQASRGARSVEVQLGKINRLFIAPVGTTQQGEVMVSRTVLASAQYRPVLDAFISPRGHVATLTVILRGNPYSRTAMNELAGISRAVRAGLAGTPLRGANVYLGGQTAANEVLASLSQNDIARTATLVLLVIGVMLILLLRSLLAPLLVLGLVTLNYLATLRIGHWFTWTVLHHPGLSWPVPFFSFLLLVALGVDYLIFYTARFREEEYLGVGEGLRQASRLAGPVIFSAALIMCGTFGSMTRSGVATLIEIGVVVVVGLVLDIGLVMGVLVPALLNVIGPILHWPFSSRPLSPEEMAAPGS